MREGYYRLILGSCSYQDWFHADSSSPAAFLLWQGGPQPNFSSSWDTHTRHTHTEPGDTTAVSAAGSSHSDGSSETATAQNRNWKGRKGIPRHTEGIKTRWKTQAAKCFKGRQWQVAINDIFPLRVSKIFTNCIWRLCKTQWGGQASLCNRLGKKDTAGWDSVTSWSPAG